MSANERVQRRDKLDIRRRRKKTTKKKEKPCGGAFRKGSPRSRRGGGRRGRKKSPKSRVKKSEQLKKSLDIEKAGSGIEEDGKKKKKTVWEKTGKGPSEQSSAGQLKTELVENTLERRG